MAAARRLLGAALKADALGSRASARRLAAFGSFLPSRGMHVKKYESQREVKNFTMVRLCGDGVAR
jgi:hypothetical protein